MSNDQLRVAMDRAGLTLDDLAALAEVDPKTVYWWLRGRTPHPRHRHVAARHLGVDELQLWPELRQRIAKGSATTEVVAAYPYRSDVPVSTWWSLITAAEHNIDLLGYTLYFLPMQHPLFTDELHRKHATGCRVRAIVADPSSQHVAYREAEEDIALTLGVRIKTTLKYLQELVDTGAIELRFQDAPLYNSVFRFDDQLIVTPHLYSTPGNLAPALHLRKYGPAGLFHRFTEHFDAIWNASYRRSLDSVGAANEPPVGAVDGAD